MAIGILLLILIFAVPGALIAAMAQSNDKRGCGRGCSTCGNYELCHGTGKYADIDPQ